MPSTRYAPEDGHFRQGRYASNEAFESGLLCNLVARRCKLIANPADRALLYFLQHLSHQEGGLDRVAAEFLAMFPERIGPPVLRRLKPGQEFSREQWEEVKRQFSDRHRLLSCSDFIPNRTPEARPVPTVAQLTKECQSAASNFLAEMLWIICLDPDSKLRSPYIEVQQPGSTGRLLVSWWFDDLLATLRLYRARCIAAAETAIAETTISKRIFDDLDYAAHCRGLVIIEGDQRTGKSTGAKNWCDRHPGQAVYVKLGVGNDDATFFRSIAKALGTAASLARKPTEIDFIGDSR